MSRLFTVQEVCQQLGVEITRIQSFVDREWIRPAGAESEPPEHYLDDCDLARARLILELRDSFGANDESIPIILHLLDQIHFLRDRLRSERPYPVGRA